MEIKTIITPQFFDQIMYKNKGGRCYTFANKTSTQRHKKHRGRLTYLQQ